MILAVPLVSVWSKSDKVILCVLNSWISRLQLVVGQSFHCISYSWVRWVGCSGLNSEVSVYRTAKPTNSLPTSTFWSMNVRDGFCVGCWINFGTTSHTESSQAANCSYFSCIKLVYVQAPCKIIGAVCPSDIRSEVHGRKLVALIQQSLLDWPVAWHRMT